MRTLPPQKQPLARSLLMSSPESIRLASVLMAGGVAGVILGGLHRASAHAPSHFYNQTARLVGMG
ncbi:MAG: hypothetical protein KDA69_17675, partial [Planctomycetaceae bacterium]|nr:hypothetical protein [Planctomycetaceae bacterium]